MEFRDLRAQYDRYRKEIDSAIKNVINSGEFIGGSEVRRLEEGLAEYVGVRHCISCANGTEAMTLFLMAFDIKEGDAVFVPDFTFFATGESVAFRGATPVLVDVERDTFNMDSEKLEGAILKTLKEGRLKPRAIIPVDLFGLPARHYEIQSIADKYKLLVLEDGAQGFGGSIRGRRALSFGNAATTSFFPSKPLGCYGDGGAIFTNDQALAEHIASLKVHGKGQNKYDNVRIGVNSRLDSIQAAVLNIKLKAFIAHELQEVNEAYGLYNKLLSHVVETPIIPEGYYSSFAQYTIKLKGEEQRKRLQQALSEKGIPSRIYYIKPMHRQEAFSALEFSEEDFKVTNELCKTVLSLPMHPYLTLQEIERIAAVIYDNL